MLSRRQLGWHFNYSNWRDQTDLYVDHFQTIDTEMSKYDPSDYTVECGFHWLACYTFLATLHQEFPDRVCFVRHEDYCIEPNETMQKIFKFSGVNMNDTVLSNVESITSGDNIEKESRRLATLSSRDAVRLADKWKSAISETELTKLDEITGRVARVLYPEENYWTIDQ